MSSVRGITEERSRKMADVRTDALEHAQIIPHEYMVGHGDSAVFQFVLMFFQMLPSVDPQPVSQVGEGKYHSVQ